MGLRKEFSGIGDGFRATIDAATGIFDPAQKGARQALADARKAGAEAIAAARAEQITANAAAKAAELTRQAEATVNAIRNPGATPKAGWLSRVGGFIFKPVKASFNAGVSVVDGLLGFVVKPVKWASQGVGKAFAHSPILATTITAGAALVGGATWFANRSAKVREADFMAHAAATEAAMNAAQPSYKNVVSHQAVDDRIAVDRANGAATHADMAAARAAQQPAATAAAL